MLGATVPTPDRIHLTLCNGALTQLFPQGDCQQEPLRSLTHSYASLLRRALAERYGIVQVQVVLRPQQSGRMRLVLGGPGVDGDAEREHIWTLAQQVLRWLYA